MTYASIVARKPQPPAPERPRFNSDVSYAARLKANLTHEAAVENARKTDSAIVPSSPKFIAGRALLKNRSPSPHVRDNGPKKRNGLSRTPLADKDPRQNKKKPIGSPSEKTINKKGGECRNLSQVFSQTMTANVKGVMDQKENKPANVQLTRKPPQPPKKVPIELEPDYLIKETLRRPSSMTEQEMIESMGERQHRRERASLEGAPSFDKVEFDFQKDCELEELLEKERDKLEEASSKASTIPPTYLVDLKAPPIGHGMTEDEMIAHLERVGEKDCVGNQYARDWMKHNEAVSPCEDRFYEYRYCSESPDSESEWQSLKMQKETDEFLKTHHESEMQEKRERECFHEMSEGLDKECDDSQDGNTSEPGEMAKGKKKKAGKKVKVDPFMCVGGIKGQPFKSKANIKLDGKECPGLPQKPSQPVGRRDVLCLETKPRKELTEEEEKKRRERIEKYENRGNPISKEALATREKVIESIAGYVAREVKAKMKTVPRQTPEAIEILLSAAPADTKARKEVFMDLLLTAAQKKKKNDAAREKKEAVVGSDHGGVVSLEGKKKRGGGRKKAERSKK